jgi:hypothetical protein
MRERGAPTPALPQGGRGQDGRLVLLGCGPAFVQSALEQDPSMVPFFSPFPLWGKAGMGAHRPWQQLRPSTFLPFLRKLGPGERGAPTPALPQGGREQDGWLVLLGCVPAFVQSAIQQDTSVVPFSGPFPLWGKAGMGAHRPWQWLRPSTFLPLRRKSGPRERGAPTPAPPQGGREQDGWLVLLGCGLAFVQRALEQETSVVPFPRSFPLWGKAGMGAHRPWQSLRPSSSLPLRRKSGPREWSAPTPALPQGGREQDGWLVLLGCAPAFVQRAIEQGASALHFSRPFPLWGKAGMGALFAPAACPISKPGCRIRSPCPTALKGAPLR